MSQGPKSKVVKARVDSLMIHPEAQRDVSQSHLKKLAAHLDLDSIGVLHAVETTIKGKSGLYLIDGQHRYLALMEHGFGEWVVEVKVHMDADTVAAACQQFLNLNSRLTVSPYATFIAELKAEHVDVVGAVNAASKLGLVVSRFKGDGKLACPATLKRVSRMGNLYEVLELITTTWGTKSEALEGKLIEGLAILLKRSNGDLDRATLIKKLQKYPGGATGILGEARGRMRIVKKPLARCVAQQVIDTYNQGRRAGRIEL